MAKKKSTWRNRIVGEGEENPNVLKANPRNWRVHSEDQQSALAGVLDDVGWVQRVIVNRATGFVVDGHMRVALAAKRGEKVIPVTYVDLTPDEERLVLATYDPIGAMAQQDEEMLDALLAVIDAGNSTVAALLDGLRDGDTAPALNPDALPALADGFEDAPQRSNDLSNVMFSFGEYRVEVLREEYLRIIEDIRQQHGFDKDTISGVLMGRLRGHAS